jgi:acyl-coenzyme A thioesterase PaaI-like protein
LDTTSQRAGVSAPAGFPAPGEPSAGRAELDRMVAGVASAPPFVTRIGLPGPSAWEYGRIVAEFSAPADTTGVEGVVFGGYIASLVDQQAVLALMSVVPDGTIQLTQRLEVKFLAPLAPEGIRVETEVVELVEHRAVCRITVSQNGATASWGRVTQMLRRPR